MSSWFSFFSFVSKPFLCFDTFLSLSMFCQINILGLCFGNESYLFLHIISSKKQRVHLCLIAEEIAHEDELELAKKDDSIDKKMMSILSFMRMMLIHLRFSKTDKEPRNAISWCLH